MLDSQNGTYPSPKIMTNVDSKKNCATVYDAKSLPIYLLLSVPTPTLSITDLLLEPTKTGYLTLYVPYTTLIIDLLSL